MITDGVMSELTARGYGRKTFIDMNHNRVVLVVGNSGTGKSLIFSQFKTLQSVPDSGLLCINNSDINTLRKDKDSNDYKIRDIIRNSVKQSTQQKVIFIDNQELILSTEDLRFIRYDLGNKYIIMGRSNEELGIGLDSFAEVVDDGKVMKIQFNHRLQLQNKIYLP